MNFKQATDALLESVTLQDLALDMGVSVQALRQARTAEGKSAHRPPPTEWETSVRRLATQRARQFAKLADHLKRKGAF